MATSAPTPATAPVARSNSGRWLQLILGVVCMVAAANIQYSWTLFVP
ncbi:oxalate/formate MFS antiporter, partial [Methylobacterium iners]